MGEIQLYGDFLTLERVSSVDVLLLSQEDFTTWIVAKDSVPLLEEAWDETYEERKVKFIGVETIWEAAYHAFPDYAKWKDKEDQKPSAHGVSQVDNSTPIGIDDALAAGNGS